MQPARAGERIRDYVPTQASWPTSSADLGIPGQVNTKRPQLSRQQIVDRIIKTNQGNPDVDSTRLNKQAPKMVQKERFEHELPLAPEGHIENDAETKMGGAVKKRNIEKNYWYPAYGCRYEETVPMYLDTANEWAPALHFSTVGKVSDLTCWTELPEFIVCDAGRTWFNASELPSFPRVELDYRRFGQEKVAHTSDVAYQDHRDDLVAFYLAVDQALENKTPPRVYFESRDQLESYMFWRNMMGKSGGLNFIMVRNKREAIEDEKSAKLSEQQANAGTLAAMLSASVLAASACISIFGMLNHKFCSAQESSVPTTEPQLRTSPRSSIEDAPISSINSALNANPHSKQDSLEHVAVALDDFDGNSDKPISDEEG